MIRIAIADDDSAMRAVMRKIIERAPGYELCFEAENGVRLLDLFDQHRPDVVLLDVEMPELSGVECARVIQDKSPKTILIFATAHERYMGDAFSVYAFDYLLKPFKLDRALKTLALAASRLEPATERESAPVPLRAAGASKRLMVKHREGVGFLDLDELLLVQREERSTVLYASGGARYVTSEPLGELEARLPSDMFFRTHKSYIVNINHIDAISPYGRWTQIIKLRGTQCDALITNERFEELQKRFI